MPHLWEAEHDYYCSDHNSFSNDTTDRWDSWAHFLEEYGEADPDYNLLFRWDWLIEERRDEAGVTLPGVDHKLYIFWMGQRHGLFHCSIVSVTESDEPAVIEYLRPRWDYLRALWVPLSGEVDVAGALAEFGLEPARKTS